MIPIRSLEKRRSQARLGSGLWTGRHLRVSHSRRTVLTAVLGAPLATPACAAISANGNDVGAELWRLINPTIGPDDVVISLLAAGDIVGAATSSWGVDQTPPRYMPTAKTESANPASVNGSSRADQLVIDAVTTCGSADSTTGGPSKMEQYADTAGPATASVGVGASAISIGGRAGATTRVHVAGAVA